MKIKAAVARNPQEDFMIEELELEAPRADEVRVRICAVGLCHTDLVFRDQAMGLALPAVFGHEGAGIVEEVGAAVTKVAPGDRVLITFRSCGKCPKCDRGQPAYCQHMPMMNYAGVRLDGTRSLQGAQGPVSSNFFGQSSFATHALTYERNVVKIDAQAQFDVYAPLGCGVQTGAGAVMRSLACREGSTLVVIGAGTVGLSSVLAAVVQRCGAIIVIEPRAERRALARELGATHVIDPGSENVVAAVRAVVPEGVDYVIDTSGFVPAIEASLGYVGSRGVIGLIGVPARVDAVLALPLALAITFGVTVMGIIEGDSEPDDFLPQLIRLHRSGKFPIERLITRYPFADINRAVADQHAGRCIKAVLVFDQGS